MASSSVAVISFAEKQVRGQGEPQGAEGEGEEKACEEEGETVAEGLSR